MGRNALAASYYSASGIGAPRRLRILAPGRRILARGGRQTVHAGEPGGQICDIVIAEIGGETGHDRVLALPTAVLGQGVDEIFDMLSGEHRIIRRDAAPVLAVTGGTGRGLGAPELGIAVGVGRCRDAERGTRA